MSFTLTRSGEDPCRGFPANHRRAVGLKAQEQHLVSGGLGVEFFLAAPVGPDVTVEFKHMRAGMPGANLVRRVERRAAAGPGAVFVEPPVLIFFMNPRNLPAADAVDQGNVADGPAVHFQEFPACFVFRQHPEKLREGHHFFKLSESIFTDTGPVGRKAGGQHDDAGVDGEFCRGFRNCRGKNSHKGSE